MTGSEQYKYFAFISYSSRDTKWGKRLQRRLENYRLPIALCRSRGWQRRPLRPVFFAPTDIQPGGLSEELQERLKASRNLIVICSPDSAKSAYVSVLQCLELFLCRNVLLVKANHCRDILILH